MGHDLSLWSVPDAGIIFLQEHPQYTADFFLGRRPTATITETVGHWSFRKKEIKVVDVPTPADWPSAELRSETTLISRGVLYYLLNGTDEKSEALTNFPHVGAPGQIQGHAIQLGAVFAGDTYAFLSKYAIQLNEMILAITAEQVKQRVRDWLTSHTTSIEQFNRDFDPVLEQVNEDLEGLRKFLDKTCTSRNGLMWAWT